MKKKHPLRRALVILLVLAVLAGGTFGGLTVLRNRGGEVNVYAAADLITSGDGAEGAQTDGIVSTDRIQSVYVSSTQQITEIYVQEGQTVRAGEPLLAFDTTLNELNLERQAIKVEQAKLDLSDAQKELEKIDTYRVGNGGGGYVPPEPEPKPLVPVDHMPYNRTPEAFGTRSEPFIFLWNDGCVFSPAFIGSLMLLAGENRTVYSQAHGGGRIVLNDPSGQIEIPDPTESPEPTETPEPTDTPAPTDTPTPTDTPAPAETAEPAETAAPADTAEPEVTPSPEITPETEDTPVPVPTPEPTPETTPELTPEPAPEATPEPTPEPAPEPTPEPTAEPAPAPEPVPGNDAGSGEGESAELRRSGGRLAPARPPRRLAPEGAEPLPEEVPAADQLPAVEDTPVPEELPAVEETPLPEEPPVTEETPVPAEPAEPTAEPEPTETPEPMDPAIREEILDPHVYVVLEVRDGSAVGGDLLRVTELVILVDPEGNWTVQLVEPMYDPTAGETDEEEPGADISGGFWFDTTEYYPASEIARMKAESTQKIRELTLGLKMAQLEYDRMEYELSNGEVYAKIDGVIKSVYTPEEARAENRPLVLVSGGGGYYVTAVLGEFERDAMAVGDTVTVQSWESGEMAEGRITEISPYPDESNRFWYYSQGNQNVSKYPFKVFIDEDASLREGEGVTLTYSAGGQESGGLFLEIPFIRQEGGKSYIYAEGENGLLEKRYVVTGRNLWGSYLEILSGLSEEDRIAFPYGRDTRDGARVRYAELDELYSRMYGGIG